MGLVKILVTHAKEKGNQLWHAGQIVDESELDNPLFQLGDNDDGIRYAKRYTIPKKQEKAKVVTKEEKRVYKKRTK